MGRTRKTTRDSEQVTVRLPLGMRDELNRAAEKNGRSANAEIVHRLAASLENGESEAMKAIRKVVKEELAVLLALIDNKKQS